MKQVIFLMALLAGCQAVFGEIDENRMKRLERYVRVESVQNMSFRNDDREKIAVLKFRTTQDMQDTEGYRVRVTVELTDKSKDSFYAQLMRSQGSVSANYLGEDRWEFHVPHGELERPKVSAYVVEYGLMDGETFVPIAVDMDDVESVEELTGRCKSRIEAGVMLKHAYSYDFDSGDATEESILRTLKK